MRHLDDESGWPPARLTLDGDRLAVAGSTVDLAELDRSVSRLGEQVASSTQAALTRLDQAVTAATHAQADTVRAVLTSDQPGTPLHDLPTHLLTGQLHELRTALEVDQAR